MCGVLFWGCLCVVVILWCELLAIRLTLDDNLMRCVREPVQDCIGNDGIGKETSPVSHGTVRRKDDGFVSEGAIDESVGAFSGELIDGFEAEIVNDQEFEFQEPLHHEGEAVLQVGGGKLCKELMEAVDADGEQSSACEVGKRFRQMRFAGAGGAEAKDALTALDEPAGGKGFDEFGVDGRIERPVEGLERLLRAQASRADESRDTAGRACFELVGHDHGEEVGIREVVAFGLSEPGFQMLANAGVLQDANRWMS
jgi:hypothetical protein